jgi:4-hydroxythreonine-4-phosphate dehydrogenase|tara:strand:+ start:9346 stop:10395 length:1050 start_codon:yes stop_codon:yes gene_type:complete
MGKKPIIAITMGDPAGIGAEVAIKTLANEALYNACNPILVGDKRVLQQALGFVDEQVSLNAVNDVSSALFIPGTIDILDLQNIAVNEYELGQVSARAGAAAFEYVTTAIELAKTKIVDATVTNPINKESINLAGHHYSGHTEIYSEYTGTRDFAMLLVGGNLRISHVTTHVPLSGVSKMIKHERILKVIRLVNDACIRFGIDTPKIGVAGLNPHAGDGGLFGDEESTEIAPAISSAREQGIEAFGPIAPDTIFAKANGGVYDGCVAMYHDQGHIPFKMASFVWNSTKQAVESISGVNVTLGLPIIRTSVDHGTAFDIAGLGIASADALADAINIAITLAKTRMRKRAGR